MMKNFLWGVLIFIFNIFIIYQNYTKNFSIPTTFFIEANQLVAFLVGILYAQQCRKFDFSHIFGVAMNSATFSILTTIVFAIYGAEVNFIFSFLLFQVMFICMFISYAVYYWLFCPSKYKKKHRRNKYEKSLAKRNLI